MIIEHVQNLPNFKKINCAQPSAQNVLMITPEFFDVEYAINPHMLDSNGQLQKVEKIKANQQWNLLKKTYEKLGFNVATINGVKGLPDMVFCANTSFPFIDSKKQKKVIKIKMHSEKRRGEVPYVMDWFSSQGYEVIERKSSDSFEGNGDALIHQNWILGGHGHRTDLKAYNEISELTQMPVLALKLVNEHFYHLDTCLSILNDETIAIVKEGLAPESLELLAKIYKNIIIIDKEEGIGHFSGNAHCPDGKNVLLHHGAENFIKKLKKFNFIPHELDTSEYIKSGGSVFCLKMMYY